MNRTIPTYVALRLLLTLSIPAVAQRVPSPYYEDTNNVPNSPEIHADRTVTLRLFAPSQRNPRTQEFEAEAVPVLHYRATPEVLARQLQRKRLRITRR